ncbi:MAG: DUF1476 domain-containing protein [Bauldia sp.]|nr:DUF1476 domain-containing protein [Bauldia sp.]
MTTFDKRKDAYEAKFARDAELRFRAEARRNRLLGRWAAELMGKKGAEIDAYAMEVVQADFEQAGDEDVFRKIKGDFDAAGVQQSDHQIRTRMDELLQEAVDQIETEGPKA